MMPTELRRQPRSYGTDTIARICGCAPLTITKAMESGKLKFYRVPCSTHRKATRDDLVEFFKSNGIWDGIPLVSRKLLGLEP